jgi:hypothetical protein
MGGSKTQFSKQGVTAPSAVSLKAESRRSPVSKLSELDLSAIDMRKITREDWEAVRREVIRRAHAERAKLMRDLIRGLGSWCSALWSGKTYKFTLLSRNPLRSDHRPRARQTDGDFRAARRRQGRHHASPKGGDL